MESWRRILRQGFMPLWSSDTLKRAIAALEADDRRLTQGSTTTPPPLMAVQDWPVEACDLIAFCSVDDPFASTVGEVEEGFARSAFACDQILGEPAACRWFLNAWDDMPRDELFREVTEELRTELARRVALEPALKRALADNPTDLVLKRACFDYLLEQGASAEEATVESGWVGEQ